MCNTLAQNCRVTNIEVSELQSGTRGYNASVVKRLITRYNISFADPEVDFVSCVDGRNTWRNFQVHVC